MKWAEVKRISWRLNDIRIPSVRIPLSDVRGYRGLVAGEAPVTGISATLSVSEGTVSGNKHRVDGI